jgi:hypothetical protein
MRILVSLVWAVALLLYPACCGRKNPDIQPTAPTPPPMAPGDPTPLPTGEPAGPTGPVQVDAALPPAIAPGDPQTTP